MVETHAQRCQGIYQRSQTRYQNRWNSYIILSDNQAMLLTSRLLLPKTIFFLPQPLMLFSHSCASFHVISILLSILFRTHLSCPWSRGKPWENRNYISGPFQVLPHVYIANWTGEWRAPSSVSFLFFLFKNSSFRWRVCFPPRTTGRWKTVTQREEKSCVQVLSLIAR